MISFDGRRLAIRGASEHVSTKKALSKFEKRLSEIESIYDLYKEERQYSKKKRDSNFAGLL